MCALTRHSLGALVLFALDVPGEEVKKEDSKDGKEEKEKKEENSD